MERVPYARITMAVVALKLLLIPAYHSTDFEVHRNWMAVTHTLPIREWYTEATSIWTLDYPPLFAWFEKALAMMAQFFDPEMLVIANESYASDKTVLFQVDAVRLSVIAVDGVYMSAVWFAARKSLISQRKTYLFYSLMIGNAGLLIVDHIHFQYNGFLIGIQLWSILAIESDHCLLAAMLYAVLLNLKHLFIYSAPVYFCYLLKRYCLLSKRPLIAFRDLAAVVLLVFGVSFGPFIYYRQIPQVMTRLFPFGRGLCHEYWAPNAWALYAFVDKCLAFLNSEFSRTDPLSSSVPTEQLIGRTGLRLLPEIPPLLSIILVLLFASIPALLLFQTPQRPRFIDAVTYANFCGFFFGYHVHEKAILTVLIPCLLGALRNDDGVHHVDSGRLFVFSTMGLYSLTPLLHRPQEYPIRILLVVCNAAWHGYTLQQFSKNPTDWRLFVPGLTAWCQKGVLLTAVLLEGVQAFAAVTQIRSRYEFLPLMMTSVLCALLNCVIWIQWTNSLLRPCFYRPVKQKQK